MRGMYACQKCDMAFFFFNHNTPTRGYWIKEHRDMLISWQWLLSRGFTIHTTIVFHHLCDHEPMPACACHNNYYACTDTSMIRCLFSSSLLAQCWCLGMFSITTCQSEWSVQVVDIAVACATLYSLHRISCASACAWWKVQDGLSCMHAPHEVCDHK
jgi:hypothetical protein